MDLILKNARLLGAERALTDIGIANGRIAIIEPNLAADGETIDLSGRFVSPGFIETHIHLDKSCILDRCVSERGDLEEAIVQAAKAKAAFTPEDVHARAMRTLEKAILQGTTHMRTHLEVDPVVGLRSLEGVLPLIKQYAWAIDLEICVFPQEGLLNNPGTDELMVEGLKRGCRVVGAAPYTDSNPTGQIDRILTPRLFAICVLPSSKSSRVMPSFRGAPPEEMMYEAPSSASSSSVVQVTRAPGKAQW